MEDPSHRGLDRSVVGGGGEVGWPGWFVSLASHDLFIVHHRKFEKHFCHCFFNPDPVLGVLSSITTTALLCFEFVGSGNSPEFCSSLASHYGIWRIDFYTFSFISSFPLSLFFWGGGGILASLHPFPPRILIIINNEARGQARTPGD